MYRAVWHGVVLAEASRARWVEANRYFPPDSLHREYFTNSPTRTLCPWKGIARYYLVEADGDVLPDAAWYYPHPWPIARMLGIRDHVAFHPDVRIEKS